MDLLTTKVVVAVLLGVSAVIVGFIPLLLARRCNFGSGQRGGVVFSCLNLFGAGVIITTALTNMLPEVNVFLQHNYRQGEISNTGLPLAEIWMLCGFFLIFLIEELTHLLVSRCQQGSVKTTAEHHLDERSSMLGHGHSHLPANLGDQESLKASISGFLVVLAISFHELFEGIAIGLAGSTKTVWLYFIAVASHKYVLAFCIALQLVTSGVRPCISIFYISVFSFANTLGAFVGILLAEWVKSEEETQTLVVTVLQGIAAGSLLFVGFLEILEKERQKGTNGLIQITFLGLGFACMLGLEFIELGVVDPDALIGWANETETLFLPCRLEENDLAGRILPLNLTCADGHLLIL